MVRSGSEKKRVILVDDEDRENEGDFIIAAEKVTPQAVNFIAKFGRGLICLAATGDRLKELDIQPMVARNTASLGTNFTVSIDAVQGVSTGISAKDTARKFDFDRCSTDYRELLRDEAIDTVLIATRHDLHGKLVLEALDQAAGDHHPGQLAAALALEQVADGPLGLLPGGPDERAGVEDDRVGVAHLAGDGQAQGLAQGAALVPRQQVTEIPPEIPQRLALRREALDAVVAAVGDVERPVRRDRQPTRRQQLARPRAGTADGGDLPAVPVEGAHAVGEGLGDPDATLAVHSDPGPPALAACTNLVARFLE